MKITMKEAILQGKDFKIYSNFTYDDDGLLVKEKKYITYKVSAKFIIENQDKLVEVEDNYWDKDGRAIRELEKDMKYYYINATAEVMKDDWDNNPIYHKEPMLMGNCFKNKESAEAELTRLKEKQKARMEQNND